MQVVLKSVSNSKLKLKIFRYRKNTRSTKISLWCIRLFEPKTKIVEGKNQKLLEEPKAATRAVTDFFEKLPMIGDARNPDEEGKALEAIPLSTINFIYCNYREEKNKNVFWS